VITKEVLERRFDDRSIQDAIFMASNEEVEEKDNVFDEYLESIYDDDDVDYCISAREAYLVVEIERDLR